MHSMGLRDPIVNLEVALWPFEKQWNGGKPPISLHQVFGALLVLEEALLMSSRMDF